MIGTEGLNLIFLLESESGGKCIGGDFLRLAWMLCFYNLSLSEVLVSGYTKRRIKSKRQISLKKIIPIHFFFVSIEAVSPVCYSQGKVVG